MARVTRERFDAARGRYLVAAERLLAESNEQRRKYGFADGWRNWITRAERNRLDKLNNARLRASSQFIALLESAPRNWDYGVPVYWLCESLSYEDAFRPVAEALSVSPPLAFGATEAMR